MFRKAVFVFAFLTAIPSLQAGELVENSHYSLTGGRYFAVAGCFRSWRAAQRQARRINSFTNAPMYSRRPRRIFWARAINTSDYPNFRRGYKCAVLGGSSRARAYERCSRLSDYNVPCYVKAGY